MFDCVGFERNLTEEKRMIRNQPQKAREMLGDNDTISGYSPMSYRVNLETIVTSADHPFIVGYSFTGIPTFDR